MINFPRTCSGGLDAASSNEECKKPTECDEPTDGSTGEVPDGSFDGFDVCLDKGLMDALWCSEAIGIPCNCTRYNQSVTGSISSSLERSMSF